MDTPGARDGYPSVSLTDIPRHAAPKLSPRCAEAVPSLGRSRPRVSSIAQAEAKAGHSCVLGLEELGLGGSVPSLDKPLSSLARASDVSSATSCSGSLSLRERPLAQG